MMTNENIEAWLLRYAEKELNPEEISEVEAYLQIHPEWAEVLSDYDPDFRLPEAKGICCPIKDRLLQNPRPGILMLPWWKYASAAAVLLLLAVTVAVLYRQSPQPPMPECVAERQPQLLPVQHENTAVKVRKESKDVSVAANESLRLPAAAGCTERNVGEASEPQSIETEEQLLTQYAVSDEGAFAAPEVNYIVRESTEQGDAAQVTYTIYTDQLLEVESEAESRPQSQPNLRQYVTGKVSDFVLKKIKENY